MKILLCVTKISVSAKPFQNTNLQNVKVFLSKTSFDFLYQSLFLIYHQTRRKKICAINKIIKENSKVLNMNQKSLSQEE